MDLLAALDRLGFSEYEARVYVALVKEHPLNGYELARRAGIPRANVYGVLDRLTQRGAVYRVEAPNGVRYGPADPEALVDRLVAEHAEVAAAARREFRQLGGPADVAQVWNVQGYAPLLEHARVAIGAAQRSLLVALRPAEARALGAELTAATERGVDATTLCTAACASECGSCPGRVYRYRVSLDDRIAWFIAVVDGEEVLAAELAPDGDASMVRTRHALVVELASAYIRNAIALATLTEDLGERLDALISPHTRAVLHTLGPAGDGTGFFEHLTRLLEV